MTTVDTSALSETTASSSKVALGSGEVQKKKTEDAEDKAEEDGSAKKTQDGEDKGAADAPPKKHDGEEKAAVEGADAPKKTHDADDKAEEDEGAVEFEDNEDRFNRPPGGRFNRVESS